MSLRVYVGPMFSGKTSELLRAITKYADVYKDRPLLINHSFDDRNRANVISSHSSLYKGVSELVDIVSASRLADVSVEGYRVIGIDEISFFEDLTETVSQWLQAGKHIICAGLDGNAKMRNFGRAHELLAMADEFVKLTAICSLCLRERGTPYDVVQAPFTAKIGGNLSTEVESGGADKYVAVCRKHYMDLTSNEPSATVNGGRLFSP